MKCQTSSTSRHISELLFTRDDSNLNTFIWKFIVRRVNSGASYKKLISNVNSQHIDEQKSVQNSPCNDATVVIVDICPKKSKKIHTSIEMLMNGIKYFAIVDNTYVLEYVRHGPISVGRIMKYINF